MMCRYIIILIYATLISIYRLHLLHPPTSRKRIQLWGTPAKKVHRVESNLPPIVGRRGRRAALPAEPRRLVTICNIHITVHEHLIALSWIILNGMAFGLGYIITSIYHVIFTTNYQLQLLLPPTSCKSIQLRGTPTKNVPRVESNPPPSEGRRGERTALPVEPRCLVTLYNINIIVHELSISDGTNNIPIVQAIIPHSSYFRSLSNGDKDGQCDNTSQSHSQSRVASNISARPPLRRGSSSLLHTLNGRKEDDDDEDPHRTHLNFKIESECEASAMLVNPDAEDISDLTHHDASQLNITRGFTSRFWAAARSFLVSDSVLIPSYANSTEITTEDKSPACLQKHISIISPIAECPTDETSPTHAYPMDMNPDTDQVPIPNLGGDTSCAATLQETPQILSDPETPAGRVHNRSRLGDTYYTGTANPVITPVRRPPQKDNFLNISTFSAKHTKTSRIRSRSESYSPAPYAVPPRNRIREGVRDKISSQNTSNTDTPLSTQAKCSERRRTASESQSRDSIFFSRIKKPGLHNCGTTDKPLQLHIQHKFLDLGNTCTLSHDMIREAALSVLNHSQEMEKPGLKLATFHYNQARVMDEHSSVLLTDLLEPISQDNCLQALMSRINNHVRSLTGAEMFLNSTKIFQAKDTLSNIMLNDLSPPHSHLCVLHIGNQRPINIIPRKYDATIPWMTDLPMEHMSLLTIFPETLKAMTINYPKESTISSSDESIIIIATMGLPSHYDHFSLTDQNTSNDVPLPHVNLAQHNITCDKDEKVQFTRDRAEHDQSNQGLIEEQHDIINEHTTPVPTPQDQCTQEQIEQDQIPYDQAERGQTSLDQAGQAQTPLDRTEQNQVSYHQAEEDRTSLDQPGQDQVSYFQAERDQTSLDQAGQAQTPLDRTEEDQVSYHQAEQDQTSLDQPGQDQVSYFQADLDQTSLDQAAQVQTPYDQAEQDQVSYYQAEQDQTSLVQAEQDQTSHNHIEQGQIAHDQADKDQNFHDQLANTPKSLLFLQKTIYTDIIEHLSSRKIKPWMKDCGIKPTQTVAFNRTLLLDHIEDSIVGAKFLTAPFISRLTKSMKDIAISTELFNFGITPKENAGERKNQLQIYLTNTFTACNSNMISPKTAARLKPRQVKRIRKSLLNQSKTKPKKLLSKAPTVKKESSRLQPEQDPSTNESQQEPSMIKPPQPPVEPTIQEGTPRQPATDAKTSDKCRRDQVCDNSEKPPDISKTQKSTRKKKGTKDPEEITEQKSQMKSNTTTIPLCDFEKPLKTLDDNIIDLKNKSCRHELMLNEVIETNTSTCGLTKIEVSELQKKVNKIEKDNATLLKTLEIQRGALSHVSDLQNEINDLKGELKDVIASNRDLALANNRLGKEFETLRELIIANNDPSPSSGTDLITKKPNKKKKIKMQSKKTQTEPHSAAIFAVEHKTAECGTQCDSSSINPPSMSYLYTKALTSNVTLPEKNTSQETRLPKQSPVFKEPKQTEVFKEPKTYSTVPSDLLQTTGHIPSPIMDKPLGASGGQKDPRWTFVDESCKPSSQKQSCLLIHDDYHDDFDPSKFTNRYEVDHYKMSTISSIRQNITKVIDKILDLNSDLVIVHAGHKDLWNGRKNKNGEIMDNLSYIIDELLNLTKAKICISLIIPGDGQYPGLDREVSAVNRSIAEYITKIRKENKLNNRVFTTNNDRLKEFMSKNVGPNGTQLSLSARGNRLLWLRLRDSMARSLKSSEDHSHLAEGDGEARKTYRRKIRHGSGNHRNNSNDVSRRR